MMNNGGGSSNGNTNGCHDFGFNKLTSLFKSNVNNNTNNSVTNQCMSVDEDEMILFSNSMLLETCLLKVNLNNFKCFKVYK